MRNVIVKTKTDKILSKGSQSISFGVVASLGIGFLANLILANSLKFTFKNIAKIQFIGFMVYLNVELPYMV